MPTPGKLLITGGGTGGHIWAGVAVAEKWKALGGSVVYVGSRGALEEKLVPKAGLSLRLISVDSLTNVSWSRRLRSLALLPFAFIKSAWILFHERPRAVLGVGGYVSGPVLLMARVLSPILGIRTAIVEQNSVAGFTNRVLGRWVHRVFCAMPGAEAGFPVGKALLTGNPIRSAMKRLAPPPTEPFTVFIFGGSKGAVGINTLIIDALQHLRELFGKIRIIHQTGEQDYERVRRAHEDARSGARVEKFIFEMLEVYASASLVVCRAGASTLSELAAVGRASILIPYPHHSDRHQIKNAETYAAAGAARTLDQLSARGEDLARLIRELMSRPDEIQAMAERATRFDRPDAAAAVARELADLNAR